MKTLCIYQIVQEEVKLILHHLPENTGKEKTKHVPGPLPGTQVCLIWSKIKLACVCVQRYRVFWVLLEQEGEGNRKLAWTEVPYARPSDGPFTIFHSFN